MYLLNDCGMGIEQLSQGVLQQKRWKYAQATTSNSNRAIAEVSARSNPSSLTRIARNFWIARDATAGDIASVSLRALDDDFEGMSLSQSRDFIVPDLREVLVCCCDCC